MKKINVISAFLFSLYISACTGRNKQKADDYIIVDVTANYPKKEFTLQYLMDVRMKKKNATCPTMALR